METQKRNEIAFGIFAVVLASVVTVFFQFRILRNLPSIANDVPSVFIEPAIKDDGAPNKISLSRLGIDAAIEPGTYNTTTGAWDLSWNAAEFATMTVAPNTIGGKTLLYAHNTRRLFGPTSKIKLGDEAVITTDSGKVFRYIYAQEKVVAPTDISILQHPEDGPPQLVLLTCSGIFNQNRRLLFFTLQS